MPWVVENGLLPGRGPVERLLPAPGRGAAGRGAAGRGRAAGRGAAGAGDAVDAVERRRRRRRRPCRARRRGRRPPGWPGAVCTSVCGDTSAGAASAAAAAAATSVAGCGDRLGRRSRPRSPAGGRRPAAGRGCCGGGLGAAFFAAFFAGAAAFSFSPYSSLRRRSTGASTVEEADLTNSPMSFKVARTTLLSTPSSLASSCTRTFATALPLVRARVGRGPLVRRA